LRQTNEIIHSVPGDVVLPTCAVARVFQARGMMIVWHFQVRHCEIKVPMKALRSGNRYEVWITDTGRRHVVTGVEIMRVEFPLSLP
jgi:hypothetical protein